MIKLQLLGAEISENSDRIHKILCGEKYCTKKKKNHYNTGE